MQEVHEGQRKVGAPCLSGFSIQGAFDSNRRNYSLIWREMGDIMRRPDSNVKNDGRCALCGGGQGGRGDGGAAGRREGGTKGPRDEGTQGEDIGLQDRDSYTKTARGGGEGSWIQRKKERKAGVDTYTSACQLRGLCVVDLAKAACRPCTCLHACMHCRGTRRECPFSSLPKLHSPA